MTRVSGGVTAAQGFLANGVSAGIKKRGKDLAILFSEKPAVVAGTLTTNAVKAASVLWADKILKQGKARAIVANSGNANCCTGKRGIDDNEEMAKTSAKVLGIRPDETLVASTGVIGRFLPMDRIKKGIQNASKGLNRKGSLWAAEAIMTTDTRPKEVAVRWEQAGIPITLGGIAKGSGMVAPHMATMLAFLTTDASVEPKILRKALQEVVSQTFNRITVDGERSTNDMVILMANGHSGVKINQRGASIQALHRALTSVCEHLSYEIARDGEGVTRLVTIEVSGATHLAQALQVARKVGESLLVKTMVAGRDPNWGRVAAAVGASGAKINPEKLSIWLGKTAVFRNGEPVACQRETLLREVDRAEVQIQIHLGLGRAKAQLLSTDLTEGYIQINAKYTT